VKVKYSQKAPTLNARAEAAVTKASESQKPEGPKRYPPNWGNPLRYILTRLDLGY